MIEIRIHGRGGQGAVIGGMLLAKAVFAEGKYVQAFPSFGVERRGAPVEAFVRIDDHIINARYQIYHPDHIIILDPTLMNSSFAFAGLKKNGTILINTKESPDHFKKHPIIKDAVELQLLLQNQYDVVLIATGAHKSSPMNITGEKLTGVISGLSFLCEQSKGKNQKIGKEVIVIGGGNTAIDAARVAKRLGSNVKILYRRTREEMPAFSHAINDAIDEGIDINFLTSPCSIIQKESMVDGLICKRTKLGNADESGRRKPEEIEGSDFELKADTIIYGTGENPEMKIIPSAMQIKDNIIVTTVGGKTSWNNIFAAGDFIKQPKTAVNALSSGKRSAIAIDCFFRKIDFDNIFPKISFESTNYVEMKAYIDYLNQEHKKTPEISVSEKREIVTFNDLNKSYFYEAKPNIQNKLSVSERLVNNPFAEIELECDKKTLAGELARCLHCGRCIDCDNCYIYCPDISIVKLDNRYEIDYTHCKGCGICVTECPRAAMELIEEPTGF